jgi:thymidine phosphorylase
MLTDMNAPVGRTAGNWLEVKEATECLTLGTGNMPASPSDLRELVIASAAHLLLQTRKEKRLNAAEKLAQECLASGAPRAKWDEMLAAQGADLKAFNEKLKLDHTAPVLLELKSSKAGFISRCDARIIGEVVRDLGGGRLTKESVINYDVGIDQLIKPGEAIQRGETLARIHAVNAQQAATASERLKTAFEIRAKSQKAARLVAEIIGR